MSHNELPKFTLLITCDNLAQIFDPIRTINFDRKFIFDAKLHGHKFFSEIRKIHIFSE